MTEKKQGFGTRVIHAGQAPDPSTGAIMPPLYATSPYVQSSPGVHQGFEYSRSHNPTRFAFERCIADLEAGTHGYAFASGLAAIGTILELLDSGDHVIAMDDLYGGTNRLFSKVRTRSSGLEFDYIDFTDLDAVRAAITPKTKMLWIETPSNPLLKLVDIRAVAQIAKSAGALLAADNTFATPWAQRPLELGADIVMHSATKGINGHSDVLAGALATAAPDAPIWQAIVQDRNTAGAVLDPQAAWLLLRGMRTLPLRMAQMSRTTQALASFLNDHPQVEEVLYPGLPSHPGHELAARQMPNGFGGLMSFVVKGGAAAALRTAGRLQLFHRATSLGGVESLVEHRHTIEPHTGIPEGLLRGSVGIEDEGDLREDLAQALGQ